MFIHAISDTAFPSYQTDEIKKAKSAPGENGPHKKDQDGPNHVDKPNHASRRDHRSGL
jgi:hypothetical protein